MSAATLVDELENLPPDEPFDWPAFSLRLSEEFTATGSFAERGELLEIRALAMELVVRQLELVGDQFEKFTDVCELEYKRLIVHETLVNGQISYEEMRHVTDREIAAGRMSDDYALRVIAVEETSGPGAADPLAPSHESLASTSAFARLKHWLHIE